MGLIQPKRKTQVRDSDLILEGSFAEDDLLPNSVVSGLWREPSPL